MVSEHHLSMSQTYVLDKVLFDPTSHSVQKNSVDQENSSTKIIEASQQFTYSIWTFVLRIRTKFVNSIVASYYPRIESIFDLIFVQLILSHTNLQ